MKACREWEQAIVEYVDGVCAPEAAGRLEAHLAQCAACAKAVEAQRWLKAALAQLERERAPAYLTRRIRDRARTTAVRRVRGRQVRRLVYAAAASVVVVMGWWAASNWTSESMPPAEEPTVAQAIVQEYVGATASDGFADPSLQMLAREAQLKSLGEEPRSP
ncbi:MAG: zf-HC2 domain-containing protein [Armatimonadota bacterium]|nr:zf-HC2 domain-containing protein [bacterium]MCS7309388.1 zf-HC2 domain-containing protein [Armatimonadota bacterium]MDW8105125.1 zf-HC2 domain-containing protein [Armatimonadota bacterium]MDW8290429.1 zf-HC2 domain-containing protein [Armatimonadota bacterium]